MDSNLHIEEYVDFNRYWQVIKRRWVPATATFVGIVTLSVVAALVSEDVYQAEAQLLIKSDRSSKLIGIPDGSTEKQVSFDDKDPLETEAKIIQSRPIIEKVISDLDLRGKNNKPLTYKGVRKSLTVEPIIGTDVLQVAYEDPDPKIAVAMVRRAVELYSEDYSVFNRSETIEAKDFIEEQIPKAEAKVKEAEENLRLFKNRHGIANLEEQTTAAIDSITTVENQIDEVKADLNDVNARYNRLQGQLGMSWQEASAVSSLSQSVSVQNVLTELQDVKVQLAQQRNFLSDNAPRIISLKEQQADLTALLEREIASTLGPQQQGIASRINVLSLGDLKQAQLSEFADLGLQKEGLEQRLASLQSAYNTYQERSNLSPQLQEQQRELQRKVDAATANYETLLTRIRDIDVLEDRKVDKVRVISNAALAEDPVNPSGAIIVAAGTMMGALFGLSLAFLLDLKDRTIKNSQEVENMFAYPLHGVVPNLNSLDNYQQLQLPGSDLANPTQITTNVSMLPLKEAYQNIQVNLKLLDADARKKVIAVTSSVPQEGKSSVAANLALARAQCGQKILLIDADMRRPTQHNIWELNNEKGLSNVLQHQIEWQKAVQNLRPNLDVMTSGSIPEHPISLLDSLFFKDFIDAVSEQYDQVIFDTPPIIGIADTKIVGKSIDGFLFVVRPGVADYDSATAAKKALDSTKLKVLGVIVNGADMSREPYHYTGYYYSTKSRV
jgi:capsular exopolysaccharide synthesis family protein